jgi:hypothetical protein
MEKGQVAVALIMDVNLAFLRMAKECLVKKREMWFDDNLAEWTKGFRKRGG